MGKALSPIQNKNSSESYDTLGIYDSEEIKYSGYYYFTLKMTAETASREI